MRERFESKFTKGSPCDCWEWEAASHERGYGYFYTSPAYSDRKMDFAHRFSYHLYNGVRPLDSECVLHNCDNPRCVNPNHLRLGTHKDNMEDMASKGRSKSGKQKLTEEDIIDIIELRESGMMVKDIAEMFNIDSGHCSRISRKDKNNVNRI